MKSTTAPKAHNTKPLATPARFRTIQKLTATAYGVDADDMTADRGNFRTSLARMHAMVLCRAFLVEAHPNVVPLELRRVSNTTVADAFKRKAHGSTTHAHKVIAEMLESDPDLKARDGILREAITARLREEGCEIQ